MRHPLLALALLLAACVPEDAGKQPADAEEAVDLRREFPEAPEDGIQWITPEMVIPAYTEQEWCYIFTYEGETVGIDFNGMYQSDYGHHVIVAATNAEDDEYPDGTFMDCTDPDAMPMASLEPLIVGSNIGTLDGETHTYEFWMPDGMAVRLPEGQRLILQSHYVNTTETPILVQDALSIGLVPEDEVETWAAAFIHTDSDFSLPPGQESTVTIDCTWEQDASIFFMTGHMHEWGTSYKVERLTDDGAETIYDVPTWDPLFRDAPPVTAYDIGAFNVSAGETFRTSCSWYNDTDQALEFPQEMCATAMMGYPSKVPVVCEP